MRFGRNARKMQGGAILEKTEKDRKSQNGKNQDFPIFEKN